VADALADDGRGARCAHSDGVESSGVVVRGAGGGRGRPRGSPALPAPRADVHVACGARAWSTGPRGTGDPGGAAGARVRSRDRPSLDIADVADASAGAGARGRATAGDRARLGEHESLTCRRPGDRRPARSRHERGLCVLDQRGELLGGDRGDPAMARRRPQGGCARTRARRRGDPRGRTLRRGKPGAAGCAPAVRTVRLLRKLDLGFASADRKDRASSRLRWLRSAARMCRHRGGHRRGAVATFAQPLDTRSDAEHRLGRGGCAGTRARLRSRHRACWCGACDRWDRVDPRALDAQLRLPVEPPWMGQGTAWAST
jgi:hypothetical protein